MPDYSKGKIYMIKCNLTGEAYYGSTIRRLTVRLRCHRNQRGCKSGQIIDRGNYDIILIKNYPCETRKELEDEESVYIRNNECINNNIPNRTKKEWLEDHKEEKSEYDKEWYENNKEYMQEWKKKWYENNKKRLKEKITCDCGCIFIRNNKTQHIRSKKHQNFINNQVML